MGIKKFSHGGSKNNELVTLLSDGINWNVQKKK